MSFFGKFVKKDGKLIPFNILQKTAYNKFVEMVPEGKVVEIFLEINSESGTLAQLAKIHAMIKEISLHTGYSFEETKLLVKERAGMCYTTSSGELICKSFGDASSETLSVVIQVIEEMGQMVNHPV